MQKNYEFSKNTKELTHYNKKDLFCFAQAEFAINYKFSTSEYQSPTELATLKNKLKRKSKGKGRFKPVRRGSMCSLSRRGPQIHRL